jgi:3-deoxy-alpha-D-manno-octulosonate 8-oxidase
VNSGEVEKMIDVALMLDPLWENALGTDWKQKMPREKVRGLYEDIMAGGSGGKAPSARP